MLKFSNYLPNDSIVTNKGGFMKTVYYFSNKGEVSEWKVPVKTLLDWEKYHKGDCLHRAYPTELAAGVGYMNWLVQNGDPLDLWGSPLEQEVQKQVKKAKAKKVIKTRVVKTKKKSVKKKSK